MLSGAPQYLVSGLTQGAAYGLIGLGFTMIFNTTGIINFAQGEFVMLGGMLAVWFAASGLPLVVAVLCACLATAVVGALMERLAIRPLAGAPAINAVIITIGVSILLRGGAMLAFGKDTVALPAFTGTAPILALGAAIQPQSLWVLAVTLALLAALKLFFAATIQGKAMLACACQQKAASLVGISVARMALLSFGLSGLIGAAAGAILAPITMTAYDVGMMLGLKGFAACILGGLGNPFGAAAGGLVLGVLEAFGAGYVASGYKDAFAFVVLLLLLFVKPSGLFGQAGVERV
ncbi:MAG: branched-chain amino acid ABC transporter permease [Solidesulfovibrio sp.]|jgi:branched-chain amino acid transport system permease protein|uniref:branched-chain amino acid ABC transporter permease n=1 Tax=Solidesulfovibrio sp. TaxID=2910990 RepID=UPI002B20CA6C|nr:branched-chain amino acid ABC transporter permease [Solidesulfovibrio sp.]MEA4855252.1 branched-chain amino acid ABC transporter permease [Solidesulfovibrio sp.]